MTEPAISPELDELCTSLIGLCTDLLDADGSLDVTLATDADGEFMSFADDDAESCYRAACDHIADLGAACTRYAIAADGLVIAADGEPASAIVFEFAERGMDHAWSGYVPYRLDADGALEVSDPEPGGAAALLFAP